MQKNACQVSGKKSHHSFAVILRQGEMFVFAQFVRRLLRNRFPSRKEKHIKLITLWLLGRSLTGRRVKFRRKKAAVTVAALLIESHT